VIHYGHTGVEPAVEARLEKWASERIPQRIWGVDPSVWSDDPQQQSEIGKRLGWLTAPQTLYSEADDLLAFADESRRRFTHVVLLGMGGSSLAPEVYSLVIGVASGYPHFRVLDSTDPGAVREVEAWCDLAKTLFIVASKSGGTVETRALGDYFYERLQAIRGERAGEHFIAITDAGTGLERNAHALGYRRVFLNVPTIGGRYSALSLFGLVPAALIGVDVKAVLDRARAMMAACGPGVPPDENPAAVLGVALGELSLVGRDKVTFLLPERWASFGNWAEQLIAESTGKNGKGLVPVALEPPGPPEVYGADRVFVAYEAPDEDDADVLARTVAALDKAGHPIVRIRLAQPDDLGYEYFRWAFATAAAGEVLHINPFDQPDVQDTKTNTVAILKAYEQMGALPAARPVLEADGLRLYGAESASDLVAALSGFLGQVQPSDYLALQAYITPQVAHWQQIQAIRLAIRDRLKVATTAAYGPRYLHSTGQLHKGGPPTGVFLQITSDHTEDVRVASRPYSFGTLIDAQAQGDWQALAGRGLRTLRVYLSRDVTGDLARLRAAIEAALS
jgi:glucose-6-phosphate isomerase/transaldolase/glucose-6-phosphate isomerase